MSTFALRQGAPLRRFQLRSSSCVLGSDHHHHQRQKQNYGQQHLYTFAGFPRSSTYSAESLTACNSNQLAFLQMQIRGQWRRRTNLDGLKEVSSSRHFSTITKGQDLLADSLTHGGQRKIILDAYYPQTGIEVLGMIEYKGDDDELIDESARDAGDVAASGLIKNTNAAVDGDDNKPQNLLMNSSVIAFPNSCFLWNNISQPKDVTLESLSIVQLLKPPIEYLFIGSDKALPPRELNRIKKEMKKRSGIVVEHMDVMNAMGTFNILNGEDRRVAVALVVDVQNQE